MESYLWGNSQNSRKEFMVFGFEKVLHFHRNWHGQPRCHWYRGYASWIQPHGVTRKIRFDLADKMLTFIPQEGWGESLSVKSNPLTAILRYIRKPAKFEIIICSLLRAVKRPLWIFTLWQCGMGIQSRYSSILFKRKSGPSGAVWFGTVASRVTWPWKTSSW